MHYRLSRSNQTTYSEEKYYLRCVKRLRSLYLARSIDYDVVVAFFLLRDGSCICALRIARHVMSSLRQT
jgi:hypothetical protein